MIKKSYIHLVLHGSVNKIDNDFVIYFLFSFIVLYEGVKSGINNFIFNILLSYFYRTNRRKYENLVRQRRSSTC